MRVDLWKAVGLALTIGAMLVGMGRYIGQLESRISALETRDRYVHGTFEVPGAK